MTHTFTLRSISAFCMQHTYISMKWEVSSHYIALKHELFQGMFFQPHKFWCPQILLDLLCINFAFPFTLLLLSAVISVDVEGNADQANWLCLWWPLLALPSLATGQKAKSDCDPFLILVLLSSVKSRSALWPCLCLIKGVQQLLSKIFRRS